MKNKNKIIVILGPTASGKTRVGVKLAEMYNGEIISADSRQVYKGMDIGTGKDLADFRLKFPTLPTGRQVSNLAYRQAGFQFPKNKEKQNYKKVGKNYIFDVPYHLIDVVSPKTEFNVVKYKKLATKAIEDILSRGKLPIIVGGTGLYLQALVDDYNLSDAKPNKELRKKLEKKTITALFNQLKKISPKFTAKLNVSEQKNKRRLIRYIEILTNKKTTPHPNPCLPCNRQALPERGEGDNRYDYLLIGINRPREVLLDRIYKRLIQRLDFEDMVGEVDRLHEEGVTWKRLESFGLEYKFISLYLQEKIDYETMVEKLNIAIRQFSKKQMSWYRRWEKQGKKIVWENDLKKINKLTKNFLK